MALASRLREPRGGPMKPVLLAVALLALAGLASVLLPDPADLRVEPQVTQTASRSS